MDQILERSDVNNIIGKISTLFNRSDDEIAIHRKYQKGIWPVKLKREQIDLILFSLFLNAYYAVSDEGHLYLETVNVVLDSEATKALAMKPGRYVKVSMTGMGACQRRIIPVVTKHEEGKNWKDSLEQNVLGYIVRRYGGIIAINRKNGYGSTVSIYLPASENEVGGAYL